MAFRVTQSMTMSSFLNTLSNSQRRMDKIMDQMTTNKKVVSITDDPTAVITAMQMRTRLSRLSQYRDNISTASAWLRSGESSIMDMQQIAADAYTSVVDAATSIKSQSDREAIAETIKQLMEASVQVANSSIGEMYIFGGYNTTKAPYEAKNGVVYYNGLDMSDTSPANLAALSNEGGQHIEFSVGFGDLTMDVTTVGTDLMGTGENNLYKILSDLYADLMNPAVTPDQISNTHVKKLQDKQSDLLSLAADYGGRANRLDMMELRYSQEEVNYTKRLSDVEDMDEAEAIMNFKMAESVYQAALGAGAKIIQPSLLDYLR